MDTVLNLGLNDTVVLGLAKKRGERFAYDCYRRLLDMFGDVVLGIDHEHFEHELTSLKVGPPPSPLLHSPGCWPSPVPALRPF